MDFLRSGRIQCDARGSVLAVAIVVAAGLWLLAGLSAAWALAGLLAAALWAALWPAPVTEAKPEPLPSPVPTAPGALPPEPKRNQPDWPSILEGIPAPALLLGRNSISIATNSGARDLLSVRPGQHLSFVIRSPDLLTAVDRAMRTRQPQSTEVQIAVPVERSLYVLVTPITAQASDGDGPALLIVFRDRTEEQQLAQLRADFVANASHELRTPLASVKGFIETLQGAAKDDPVARERFLGIMHDQASRMSRLIEDLLSLSRIEMREHVTPRDLVDLAEIVESVAKAVQPLAEKGGQHVAVTIEERPENVRGDRDELAQIAQNLVQNAIKYGRPDGHVNVTVSREGSRIALAVADNGIGIAPEHVPRLTERFYRVSAKDSRERGGTGLGLAIVKHIVNRHRGELRIASELGKGSTFTVLLPASDREA